MATDSKQYLAVYAFSGDKKRQDFMVNADEFFQDQPQYWNTFDMKVKGMTKKNLYKLIDILHQLPNETDEDE